METAEKRDKRIAVLDDNSLASIHCFTETRIRQLSRSHSTLPICHLVLFNKHGIWICQFIWLNAFCFISANHPQCKETIVISSERWFLMCFNTKWLSLSSWVHFYENQVRQHFFRLGEVAQLPQGLQMLLLSSERTTREVEVEATRSNTKQHYTPRPWITLWEYLWRYISLIYPTAFESAKSRRCWTSEGGYFLKPSKR